MFKTIIVGVDGKEGGEDAIALARLLGGQDADLVAVCVAVLDSRVTRAVNRDYEAVVVEGADETAAKAASEHDGLRAAGAVAPSVAVGLHEAAEREAADLIVVGSCRRGRVGRILAGDDARETVRAAPCPVAVAPVGFAERAKPFARIGVGYDGGPEAKAAVEAARDIAGRAGLTVNALDVIIVANWSVPPSGVVYLTIDEERAAAQQRMDKLEGVTGEVRMGSPFKELEAFSEEVDLLVVGSRQHGAIGRVVMGSAAESLTRNAHAPLLVVPRPAEVADEAIPPAETQPARS
jgi:nucleotide-binding universal stress UspA family protein